MALAMILQYFDLRLVNPSYILRVKETLTQKPDGLEVHATLRDIHASSQIEKSLFGGESSPHRSRELPPLQNFVGATSKPITILYGSNSGTCEGLARSLASRSVAHGFTANVATMDSSISNLPKDQPVIFLTASFEGEPADNASLFFEWISSITDDTMRGLTFAVFGCGHRDWALTYQKIPKIIDKELERLGATRLVCRGESDVSMGTVLDDFDSWTDEKLWPALAGFRLLRKSIEHFHCADFLPFFKLLGIKSVMIFVFASHKKNSRCELLACSDLHCTFFNKSPKWCDPSPSTDHNDGA